MDVWALGSLFVEMLTGDPLFAGDSDIDQLHHIVRCFGATFLALLTPGTLCPIHLALMQKNPSLARYLKLLPKTPSSLSFVQLHPVFTCNISFRFPDAKKIVTLESRLKIAPQRSIEFAKVRGI